MIAMTSTMRDSWLRGPLRALLGGPVFTHEFAIAGAKYEGMRRRKERKKERAENGHRIGTRVAKGFLNSASRRAGLGLGIFI